MELSQIDRCTSRCRRTALAIQHDLSDRIRPLFTMSNNRVRPSTKRKDDRPQAIIKLFSVPGFLPAPQSNQRPTGRRALLRASFRITTPKASKAQPRAARFRASHLDQWSRKSFWPAKSVRSHNRTATPFQRNGGAGRDRTDDLKLAKLPLSQLSYGPFMCRSRAAGLAQTCAARGRACGDFVADTQPSASQNTLTMRQRSRQKAERPPRTSARSTQHHDSEAVERPNGRRALLRVPMIKWWAWDDSNVRPHPYQGCALTT